nr:nuclear pore complex protein NUP155 [Tanacetum cinerariifolium]
DNIISGLPLFSAITPDELVLSTEEPDNSLSMRDEHLDTIPATESDEFIKSSVEDLIPIPSEPEGILDHRCDVPSHDNSPPLDVSKDQFEDFFESNEEFSSTDDDSFFFDKIDYVEASPPDSELVSSEIIEIVIPKEEIIPMKSLRTHDSSLPISSKIDSLLDEFAGELTLLKLIPPGIDETDCDFEEDIRLIEKLLDILIPKDLPSNNTLSFAEKESFHFDIPPFSHPLAKPPDVDDEPSSSNNSSKKRSFQHILQVARALNIDANRDVKVAISSIVQAFSPPNITNLILHVMKYILNSFFSSRDSGLLDLLEGKLTVLMFQIKIIEELEKIASKVESTPVSKEKVKELSLDLKSITHLYNEYAVPFEFWEICLKISLHVRASLWDV